ncbi:acyltransferase [Planktotalea frisia]|nr:acyltransferase [Planktotalea frisia]
MTEPAPTPLHIARLDTLRAVAVSVVVFFHLLPEALPWGYIGVDMFFSLSGFLMTLLYLQARATGRDFPAAHFVARRFWRIFPALAITVLVTLLGSFALLASEHLNGAGRSGIAAIFSVSNWVFFTESGYFDTDAIFKPLLHTWSLGVEEQFYVLFALALLCQRFVPLWVVLALISAVSFGLWLWVVLANAGFSLVTLHNEPFSALFFLPQYRAFQFTLGGLAAYWLMNGAPRQSWLEALGGTLMLFGFWSAASKEAAHISALIVTLGMVVLMVKAPLLDACAGSKVLRYVARISYQLYLVHWPVIVFWHYITLAPLSWGEAVICAVICIALADLLYHLTNPLRAQI